LAESISESLLSTASQYAEKPAIIDGEKTLTYREYAGGALAVAHLIEREDLGEKVAIMLPTSASFALVFFGTMLSGRIPVPLNFFLAGEELAYILRDCGARTLVTTRFFEKSLAGLDARIIMAEDSLPEALGMPPARPKPPNHIATILYTSGTIGVPKGVILSHGNILANALGCVEHFNFRPEHVLLAILPFFHTFALTTTLVLPAAIGATVVVMSRFEPSATLESIARHRVTTMVAVPSMYRALVRALERGDADLSSLSLPISGGEPLPEDVFETYRDRYATTIYEGYGLTETSPVVAANTPANFKPFTVGKPLANVEVRVVDDAGQDAGINVDGEIWVRGESVMQGYLNLADQTRDAITGNAFFRTGDIGRVDWDGFLRITGRKKEMMISAGENIFPREIELVIARHEAVAEVAVIGIPDPVRGEAPKAFVVLKDGAAATEDELREFCRRHIAKFKVPSQIEFCGEFPHSPTGKILKQRLVEGRGGGRR